MLSFQPLGKYANWVLHLCPLSTLSTTQVYLLAGGTEAPSQLSYCCNFPSLWGCLNSSLASYPFCVLDLGPSSPHIRTALYQPHHPGELILSQLLCLSEAFSALLSMLPPPRVLLTGSPLLLFFESLWCMRHTSLWLDLHGTVIAWAMYSFSTVTSTTQQFSTLVEVTISCPAIPRGMRQGLESFSMISAEKGCYWHAVNRSQEYCSIPWIYRTTSTAQLSKTSKMLKWRDCVLGLKAPGGGEHTCYLLFPWNSQHGSLIHSALLNSFRNKNGTLRM